MLEGCFFNKLFSFFERIYMVLNFGVYFVLLLGFGVVLWINYKLVGDDGRFYLENNF